MAQESYVSLPEKDAGSACKSVLFSGFYKKSVLERRELLDQVYQGRLQTDLLEKTLSADRADTMIENCVGVMGIPLGLTLNLVMNGKVYHAVPMCTEEPSVIAAVSGAFKLLQGCESGSGLVASASDRNIIIAQIFAKGVSDSQADLDAGLTRLSARKKEIIDHANTFCPSMHKRGGGVLDGEFRSISLASTKAIVTHLHIDVREAMGANVASTVAEAIAPFIQEILGETFRIRCKILSNLATERVTRASFRISTDKMAYKGFSGLEVAQGIIDLTEWANFDEFRAATHNKGIMNGIDAVCMATGQDWRAMEAGMHAYAAISAPNSQHPQHPRYQSLTSYRLEDNGRVFTGAIEMPTSLGVCGGAIKSNPMYAQSLAMISENITSAELSQVMACVGLAQNLAALRALATEGIQRGHMSLHAKHIAMAAGVPLSHIANAVSHMISQGKIDVSSATEYMKACNLNNCAPL